MTTDGRLEVVGDFGPDKTCLGTIQYCISPIAILLFSGALFAREVIPVGALGISSGLLKTSGPS